MQPDRQCSKPHRDEVAKGFRVTALVALRRRPEQRPEYLQHTKCNGAFGSVWYEQRPLSQQRTEKFFLTSSNERRDGVGDE